MRNSSPRTFSFKVRQRPKAASSRASGHVPGALSTAYVRDAPVQMDERMAETELKRSGTFCCRVVSCKQRREGSKKGEGLGLGITRRATTRRDSRCSGYRCIRCSKRYPPRLEVNESVALFFRPRSQMPPFNHLNRARIALAHWRLCENKKQGGNEHECIRRKGREQASFCDGVSFLSTRRESKQKKKASHPLLHSTHALTTSRVKGVDSTE